MSTILMAACWPLQMPATAKVVLVSIADQANDEGVCWPSVSTLCLRTCLKERTVRAALAWLCDHGAIAIGARHRDNHARSSNTYVVTVANFDPLDGGRRVELASQPASFGVAPAVVYPPASRAPSPAPHAPTPLHHMQGAPAAHAGHEPSYEPPGGRTPVVPCGDHPPKVRKQSEILTLDAWLAQCRAKGERAIPLTDPVIRYAESIDLSPDMLLLAWSEFKRRYATKSKRYRDWRAVFRRAVEGNWFRLWYADQRGAFALTTQGLQAHRLHEAEARERAE